MIAALLAESDYSWPGVAVVAVFVAGFCFLEWNDKRDARHPHDDPVDDEPKTR